MNSMGSWALPILNVNHNECELNLNFILKSRDNPKVNTQAGFTVLIKLECVCFHDGVYMDHSQKDWLMLSFYQNWMASQFKYFIFLILLCCLALIWFCDSTWFWHFRSCASIQMSNKSWKRWIFKDEWLFLDQVNIQRVISVHILHLWIKSCAILVRKAQTVLKASRSFIGKLTQRPNSKRCDKYYCVLRCSLSPI